MICSFVGRLATTEFAICCIRNALSSSIISPPFWCLYSTAGGSQPQGGEPHGQQQKAQRAVSHGTLGRKESNYEKPFDDSDIRPEHPNSGTGRYFIKEMIMEATLPQKGTSNKEIHHGTLYYFHPGRWAVQAGALRQWRHLQIEHLAAAGRRLYRGDRKQLGPHLGAGAGGVHRACIFWVTGPRSSVMLP